MTFIGEFSAAISDAPFAIQSYGVTTHRRDQFEAGQERSSAPTARQWVSRSVGQHGFRTMRFNATT